MAESTLHKIIIRDLNAKQCLQISATILFLEHCQIYRGSSTKIDTKCELLFDHT